MSQRPEEGSGKKRETPFKDKTISTLRKLVDEERLAQGKEYFRTHTLQAIMGILLILFLLLTPFFPLFAGTILAFLVGLNLSQEFVKLLGKVIQYATTDNHFKAFVVIVAVLGALFIDPFASVALGIGVCLRWLLQPKSHSL